MKNSKKIQKSSKPVSAKKGAAAGRIWTSLRILLPVMLVVAVLYGVTMAASTVFTVSEVVFIGNEHLGEEELKVLAGLTGKENLLTMSGKSIFSKMSASPWIESVTVRKEVPHRLRILVRETKPFALLDMKGHTFIVDERGRMLDELKDSTVPFLPIISGDPFQKKEVFHEALNLVKVIRKRGGLQEKDRLEIIAFKPQELSLNLDGVLIKMGVGEYDDKLSRLIELKEEIKKRGIPVDYVDLRFAKQVVVKPVNEVVR